MSQDTAWYLMKTLSKAKHDNVPTWAAYTLLISDSKPLTNVTTLPIIPGNPTEWENLYSAIREADKVQKEINSDIKTIISFDLQLYAKLIHMRV